MTEDGPLLLASIIREQKEDTPRLMFADWLEEEGSSLRAEFIRKSIERANLNPRPILIPDTGNHTYSSEGNHTVNLTTREPINPDKIYDVYFPGKEARKFIGCVVTQYERRIYEPSHHRVEFLVTGEPCPIRVRCDELDKELIQLRSSGDENFCDSVKHTWANSDYSTLFNTKEPWGIDGVTSCHLNRGFADSLVCSWSDFEKLHERLIWHPVQKRPCPLTAHPIETVRFTTHTGCPIRDPNRPMIPPDPDFDKKYEWNSFVLKNGEYTHPRWPGIKFKLLPHPRIDLAFLDLAGPL